MTLFLPRRAGRPGPRLRLAARARQGERRAEREDPSEGRDAAIPAPRPSPPPAPATGARHPRRRSGRIADRRDHLLWVDDVTVSFDGFKALDELTLTLEKGELRCIIGPNGAGKTTLMDVITGKTRPDKRQRVPRRRRTDLTRLSEYEIAELGIGRKFQRPTVFQGHTVFENLELALRGRKGVWRTLFARLAAERDAHRRGARDDRPGRAARARRPACCRTARSSGWRSACCWCRTPRCCCRRAGRRHDPPGDRAHRRAARSRWPASTPSWWSSTTWSSCAASPEGDRAARGQVLAEGPWTRCRTIRKVIEVYLGA